MKTSTSKIASWKEGLGERIDFATAEDLKKCMVWIEGLLQQQKEELVKEIKKAVNKAGDLSMFGSASGGMMKQSMLDYLDSLGDKK